MKDDGIDTIFLTEAKHRNVDSATKGNSIVSSFLLKIVRLLVFTCHLNNVATSNNISVISLHSVFLVEETVVSWENHRPDLSYRWNIITYGFIEYNSTPAGIKLINGDETYRENGGELRCSRRVSSSCSTSDTCHVTLVKYQVVSHERQKENRIVTTANKT